jgi:MFS family permease
VSIAGLREIAAASLGTLGRADSRRLLLLVFVIDALFAFVFLIALQSYFQPQRMAGTAVPGLALALFGAGKLASQYVAGRHSDAGGARAALQLALLAIAGSFAILLFAEPAPVLVIPAALAYGVGSATVWPALYVEAQALPVESRAQLASAMTLTTGAGLAAALALGAILPSDLRFSLALGGGGLLLVVAFIATLGVPERRMTAETTTRVSAGLLASPPALLVGATYFFEAAAIGALLSIFRTVGLQVLHVSLRQETLLLLPACACFGAGVLVAGVAGESIGRARLLALGLGLAGVAFLGAGQASGREIALVSLCAGGFGLGMSLPMTTAAALDAARSLPGTTFGFVLTLEGLGHVAGPALSAGLANVDATLALAGVLLLAACAAALGLSRVQAPSLVTETSSA